MRMIMKWMDETCFLCFVLQKALVSPAPAVSTVMKEIYLQWAYRTGGYKKARKLFTRYTYTHTHTHFITDLNNTLMNIRIQLCCRNVLQNIFRTS